LRMKATKRTLIQNAETQVSTTAIHGSQKNAAIGKMMFAYAKGKLIR
jgi:hypothetical protein